VSTAGIPSRVSRGRIKQSLVSRPGTSSRKLQGSSGPLASSPLPPKGCSAVLPGPGRVRNIGFPTVLHGLHAFASTFEDLGSRPAVSMSSRQLGRSPHDLLRSYGDASDPSRSFHSLRPEGLRQLPDSSHGVVQRSAPPPAYCRASTPSSAETSPSVGTCQGPDTFRPCRSSRLRRLTPRDRL
jgi:hypothetical protein